jgi:uncharacterized protein (TIGR02646 family)
MRYIRKNPSPQAFEDWKKANNPTHWDVLQNEPPHREEGVVYYTKRELRETLLIEQGYLCCYCQQRIENIESTVIEHFYPRNGGDKVQGRAKMFDYNNLLAACDGGSLDNRDRPSNTPSFPQYCDKNKDEELLPLSPLQPDVESRLIYSQRGLDEVRIDAAFADDTDAVNALEKILNLNTPKLKNLRGKAITGLIFTNPDTGEIIPVAEAKRLLADMEQQIGDKPGGYLPEFCEVKLHFLRLLSGKA